MSHSTSTRGTGSLEKDGNKALEGNDGSWKVLENSGKVQRVGEPWTSLEYS